MKTTPSYFAVIPANVRYDSRLSANEKLLYGEITALANKDGYCWASNAYFAELYGVTVSTVSEWISDLQRAGYVRVSVDRKAGNTRKIFITSGKAEDPLREKPKTYSENPEDPSSGKAEDNNTRYNKYNNNINNIKREGTTATDKPSHTLNKRFVKPTVEKVSAYCQERANGIDPQTFIDFYEAKGWRIGKEPMRDWQAAIRTWERRQMSEGRPPLRIFSQTASLDLPEA